MDKIIALLVIIGKEERARVRERNERRLMVATRTKDGDLRRHNILNNTV